MNSVTGCENEIWLRRIDDKNRLIIYITVPCGRKKCKFCANEMRKNHYKRIAYTMHHRPDWHWFFVTTTGKSWWHKVDDKAGISLVQIRKVWAKWRKRLARSVGKSKLIWLRVYEQHEDGVYHCHIIFGTDAQWWAEDGIAEKKIVKLKAKRRQKRKVLVTEARIKTDRRSRWVKTHWEDAGGGYQIHLKEIHMNENAKTPIRYVVKYAVKSATDTSRVIEYSRNFPKLNPVPEDKIKYQWLMIGTRPTAHEIAQWRLLRYATVGA